MTFYDVLSVSRDASTEDIERAVERQRSALTDGAVYPDAESIESDQLRHDRRELVEEAAEILLDSTSKAAYDTFLRELGEIDGHLEYLRWRMHPAQESLSPPEWIERYADTQTPTAQIDNTRVLSAPDATGKDTDRDDPTTGSESGSAHDRATTAEPASRRGVLSRGYELLGGTVKIGLGLMLVLFEFVYSGLASVLSLGISIGASLLTLLRGVGASLSLRGVGAAALGFPFVFVGLSYGTSALADAVPGIASEAVIAVGVVLIVLVHLFYILTPRAGITVFSLFAVGGYLGAADESILLTYVYVPCCILAVVVLVALPTEA